MSWEPLDHEDIADGAVGDFGRVNDIGQNALYARGSFIRGHLSAGTHNDDILVRGWGYVTYSGGTPSMTKAQGIVNTGAPTDGGTGICTIDITTDAASVNDMCVIATCTDTTASRNTSAVVKGVDTIDVHTWDASNGNAADVNFYFFVLEIPT